METTPNSLNFRFSNYEKWPASPLPQSKNVQPGGKAQSHTGSATNNEDRGAEGSGGQVQGRPIVVIVIGFMVVLNLQSILVRIGMIVKIQIIMIIVILFI